MGRKRVAAENPIVAAESGGVDAQYKLGLMYSTGKGVPLDYVLAHKWLNLAALRGDDGARSLRSELAGDMSREEIAEAQRLAREWMDTHQEELGVRK